MNAFFTSVGFLASFSVVKRGGKALLVFVVCIAILAVIQTLVAVGLCSVFGIDKLMGSDYDAAVFTAGHYGFGMGATPNAMANMDALTSVYGPSEKSYLVIPICGGFLTDIVNIFLITLFMGIL